MKKTLSIACLAFLIFIFQGAENASSARKERPIKNYLKNIEVKKNNGKTEIIAEFTKELSSKERNVKTNEKSVLLELPDVFLNASKRMFRFRDDMVSRAFVYRGDKDQLTFNLTFLKKIEKNDLLDISNHKNKLIVRIEKAGKVKTRTQKAESINGNMTKTGKTVTPLKNNIKNVSQTTFDINELEKYLKKSTVNTEEQLINKVVQGSAEEKENMSGRNGSNKKEIATAQGKSGKSVNIGLPILFNEGEKEGEVKDKNFTNVKNEMSLEKPGKSQYPDLLSGTVKMAISLTIILALILVITYLIKKYFISKNGILNKGKSVKVLSSSYIGGKKNILLVQVEDEVLVLGVTPNSISMLTKLGNNDINTVMSENRRDNKSRFSRELGKYSWNSGRRSKEENVDTVTENIKKKIRELKRI